MLPGDSFVSRTNDSHCQLSRFMLLVGLALGVLSLVPMAQADIVFSESFETSGQGVRYMASDPFNVMQSSNGAYWNRGERNITPVTHSVSSADQ